METINILVTDMRDLEKELRNIKFQPWYSKVESQVINNNVTVYTTVSELLNQKLVITFDTTPETAEKVALEKGVNYLKEQEVDGDAALYPEPVKEMSFDDENKILLAGVVFTYNFFDFDLVLDCFLVFKFLSLLCELW